MRIEVFILVVCCLAAYNAYYDNKYWLLLLSYRKHYKVMGYLLFGVVAYLLIKKDPNRGKNLLFCVNNMVQKIPITSSLIEEHNPVVDFTKRMYDVSQKPVKRVVSETRKKFVASSQNWRCGHCKKMLDHTFEIDHEVSLEKGGSNEVSNLIALCRNCHGLKTASENM